MLPQDKHKIVIPAQAGTQLSVEVIATAALDFL